MHLLRLSFNQSHSIQPYTLSLHDALPISRLEITIGLHHPLQQSRIVIAYFAHEIIEIGIANAAGGIGYADFDNLRSEEHTSELQSRLHLVCRLLLEKKKQVISLDHVQIRD